VKGVTILVTVILHPKHYLFGGMWTYRRASGSSLAICFSIDFLLLTVHRTDKQKYKITHVCND